MKRIMGLALTAVLVVSTAEALAAATTVQTVPVFEATGGPPGDFPVGKSDQRNFVWRAARLAGVPREH